MGFLHATPEGATKTRWQELKTPQMPRLEAGQYLFDAFTELGLVEVGMSIMPLSWAEIDAYQRLTGEIAEPWEARLLRQMSQDYIAGRQIGQDPLGIAPMEAENG